MSVSISIHVDGYYGLKKGVPNLLDLFDKYGIRASFFINMGSEAGISKILRYRTKNLKKSDKESRKRYNKLQIMRMLVFPRNLGNANCRILREIERRGHELNPHCWSHLLWSRNFEKLNIRDEFIKMISSFERCAGRRPEGFVPPTWKWDHRVLREMKELGFKYLSAKEGKIEFREGILIIPLTFESTIEELVNKGINKEEIIKIYNKELGKKFVNLYFHADYEGIDGQELLEEILKNINKKDVLTLRQVYEKLSRLTI